MTKRAIWRGLQAGQQKPERAAPAHRERRVHIALADLLRMAARPGWWWSHIPSGEHRTEQTGALLKRMGLQPGMLDYLLIDPGGEHFWLELKVDGGTCSEAQIDFIDFLRTRTPPVTHAVARSFDGAVVILKAWGAL